MEETRDMKIWKQRLAVLLSLALAFTMMIGVMPQTEQTVQAATSTNVSVFWAGLNYQYGTGYSLNVEKGQTFNLAALCFISDSQKKVYDKANNVSGETYSSSNSKVITLSKKGMATPKQVGTSTVKVKYKGKYAEVNITVVAPGKLGSTSASARKYNSTIKTYSKGITTLTTKNRYKVLNNYMKLSDYLQKMSMGNKYNYNGFRYEKASYIDYQGKKVYYYKATNDLVVTAVPGAIKDINVYEYVRKFNPIGTLQSKTFKIKSVTAQRNKNSFKINLKSKVNANQFFGAQASDAMWTGPNRTIKDGTKATFQMQVYDMTAKKTYEATVTMKKSSSVLTVKLAKGKKLVKNHKYRLKGTVIQKTSCKYGWTLGKTFTVK